MTGTSPPGPFKCGSTTCSVNAVATAASKALPPFSRMPMPTAVAIQCVVVTTPNVPSISGRVVKAFGLILVINNLLLRSGIGNGSGRLRGYEPAHRDFTECIWRRAVSPVWGETVAQAPLKVGLAGLGAVGLGVARR